MEIELADLGFRIADDQGVCVTTPAVWQGHLDVLAYASLSFQPVAQGIGDIIHAYLLFEGLETCICHTPPNFS